MVKARRDNLLSPNPKQSDEQVSIASIPQPDAAEHFVQFYDTDAFLLDSLGGFIGTGLAEGFTCIAVATKEHRDGVEQRLNRFGFDLPRITESGKYFSIDAHEALSSLLVNNTPDPRLFRENIGGLLAKAAAGGNPIRVFGEMVGLLWADGEYETAVALEEMWNQLQSALPFSLLCAYPVVADPYSPGLARSLARICAEHSSIS